MKPGIDFIGVGVFVLVFDETGKIMLVNHKQTAKKSAKYADKWSMPGGTVEYGENCIDALKREIKEELDLEIYDTEPLNFYDSIENDRHWIGLSYKAKTKGTPKNMEPHKIAEIKFFKKEDAPQNVSDDCRRCLVQLGVLSV